MKLTHPLVSTDWLAANLEHPTLRIFDATVFLHANTQGPGYIPESGRARWAQGHIPRAGFLDLIEALSDQNSSVRFTMPSAQEFATKLGAQGIGDDSVVVLYSAGSMMWSTRVWWMLQSIGFTNAAVLDGGWEKWQREGRPVNSDLVPFPIATLTPRARPALWTDKADVMRAMQDSAVCTINALSPDVFSGAKNMYGRAGHIPGSYNVFYNNLLNPETGTYQTPDVLREQFTASGAFTRERVIVYCGGGISATMDALALAMAGHSNVAVYDGSMMEWVADTTLPLNLGEHP